MEHAAAYIACMCRMAVSHEPDSSSVGFVVRAVLVLVAPHGPLILPLFARTALALVPMMIRIEWAAIHIATYLYACSLGPLFSSVMVCSTQRLPVVRVPEQRHVAPMGRDVVYHRCGSRPATHHAQGMLSQICGSSLTPCSVIELCELAHLACRLCCRTWCIGGDRCDSNARDSRPCPIAGTVPSLAMHRGV